MADMKISDLPVAPNVNDAQQFEVNDGGNSRRVTFGMVRDKIKDELGKPLTAFTTPTSWDDLPATYPKAGLIPVLIRRNLSGNADNNGPPGYLGHYYYVQQFFYHDGSVAQLAIPWTTAQLAFRARNNNGDWMAWRRVFDSINGTLPTTKISDSTVVGRNVLTSPTSAGARAAIGAGTSNLVLGTTATTAKPGNWKPNIDTDTTGQLPYSRLTDVPDFGGAQYTAGDTYVVGRTSDFMDAYPDNGAVPYDWSRTHAFLSAADGVLRLRVSQFGRFRVLVDGIQKVFWSWDAPVKQDKTVDLPIGYGEIIDIQVRPAPGTFVRPAYSNLQFLSATTAPLLVPVNLNPLVWAPPVYVPPPPSGGNEY